ncbi:MAG: hypothetical protein ACT4ON_14400 [Bacteroidota bacterium]
MELFKKSDTPEAFEKSLNEENSKVNNLDLNGDGETDYIKVIDRAEGDAHALVLQVPVNETESQDVAVIEIEKKDNETAHVQVIGDEDLYGKNYIVEPAPEQVEVGTSQPPQPVISTSSNPPVVVNVWAWPTVRHVYGPKYVVWTSPWRWRHYPGWWKPWKPFHYHVYRGRVHPYRAYHHRVHVHRVVRAHGVYHNHRVVSKTVHQRRVVAKPHHGRQMQKQQAPRGQRAKGNQPKQHKGPRK